MKKIAIVILFIALFPIVCCNCSNDMELANINGPISRTSYLGEETEKWSLNDAQLQRMFKTSTTFGSLDIKLLTNQFKSFLDNNPYYRRIVYEIYQEIKRGSDKEVRIRVEPGDPMLNENLKLNARYDYKDNEIIFRQLKTSNISGPEFVTLIHELIHHWQNLVVGKNCFNYENLRNTEFEVIFLLDLATVQNNGMNFIASDMMYLKSSNLDHYTIEQINEYHVVLIQTLNGNAYSLRDKFEILARNYKMYQHVGYSLNWGFVIIDRLWGASSLNY